ncbi:hypothetical protein S245_016418 [Arachis hypogaea]
MVGAQPQQTRARDPRPSQEGTRASGSGQKLLGFSSVAQRWKSCVSYPSGIDEDHLDVRYEGNSQPCAMRRGVDRRPDWDATNGSQDSVEYSIDRESRVAQKMVDGLDAELGVEGCVGEASDRAKHGGQYMFRRGRVSKLGKVGGVDNGVGHDIVNERGTKDAGSETEIEGTKPNTDKWLTQEGQSTDNKET